MVTKIYVVLIKIQSIVSLELNHEKVLGKDLSRTLSLKDLADCKIGTLLKKRSQYRFFSMNFVKFHRAAFCRTTVHNCLWKLRGARENKCSSNQNFITEYT